MTILVFSGACWSSSMVSLALYCSKADLVVLVLMSSMKFFRSLFNFSLLIVSNFLPEMERFVGIKHVYMQAMVRIYRGSVSR